MTLFHPSLAADHRVFKTADALVPLAFLESDRFDPSPPLDVSRTIALSHSTPFWYTKGPIVQVLRGAILLYRQRDGLL